MAKLSVTLLNADWSNLASDIRKIEALGVDYIHHDVMDGHFVPNISFGSYAQECIHKVSKKPIETHMMVYEPQRFAESYAKAGSTFYLIHFEACGNLASAIEECQKRKLKVGLVLNPNTLVENAEPYLRKYDIAILLLMGVYPGFGGQSFIPETVSRLKQARHMIDRLGVKTLLEVDGGVNASSYKECLDAGADILATGSYVTKNLDKAETRDFVKAVHLFKRK
ncbi:MAG: ribulose-phosphate 3-epimerase [Candidatus Micrarchaeia archaeon]|jgi:ribulose-phosphate 3-epimerase